MKKIAPIAIIALLSLASCKKEWTCECSTTINGVTTTSSAKTGKVTKKDAKAACEKSSTVSGYTVSCKIK